jgi:hypothetical protein
MRPVACSPIHGTYFYKLSRRPGPPFVTSTILMLHSPRVRDNHLNTNFHVLGHATSENHVSPDH